MLSDYPYIPVLLNELYNYIPKGVLYPIHQTDAHLTYNVLLISFVSAKRSENK